MHLLYALEFAQNGQTVAVVAEDTQVLIMLVYHWRNVMEDVFIRKESRLSRPREMYTSIASVLTFKSSDGLL